MTIYFYGELWKKYIFVIICKIEVPKDLFSINGHFENVNRDSKTVMFVPFLVHCEKGEWGNWSPCTKSCDGGEETRERSIAIAAAFGGNECTEDMKESQACKIQSCPSTYLRLRLLLQRKSVRILLLYKYPTRLIHLLFKLNESLFSKM